MSAFDLQNRIRLIAMNPKLDTALDAADIRGISNSRQAQHKYESRAHGCQFVESYLSCRFHRAYLHNMIVGGMKR